MVSGSRGQVDFGREGFIARFEYDPAIVARIKQIQRRRWNSDLTAWLVEPHWPSVHRLLCIASELNWTISAEARAAELKVREDGESCEYSLDVVHDSHGAAWFQCKLGDDDQLSAQVKALPGAYWDEHWWVPTDWDQCCGPLLEIAQSDARLEVSNAAWRLLEEQDVSDQFVRSSAPAPARLETCEPEQDPAPDVAPVERRARVTTRGTRQLPPRAERDAG